MKDLLVDALAVYRLTRLIAVDSISEPLRDLIERRAPLYVANLVTCPHCLSVWFSFGVLAARRYAPRQWDPVARALAFAAVASLAADVSGELED